MLVMSIGNKIEFEVIQAQEGTYAAACYAKQIYTEGNNLQELHDNIKAAINKHYPDDETRPTPESVSLILFRDINAMSTN